jgi:hypothetical protein
MVTKFPGATYRPLEATQRQATMQRHDIVCLHTMVGTLTGTDRMFKANGWSGTESHFGVGGKWGDGRDGEIIQWQDTEHRADANLDGNRRIISIETGDNAPRSASDIEPWTPKQLDAIVAITVWACRKYDIPAVLLTDSGPGRRGIAYHRLGVQHSGGTHPAGFLQPGCEKWSTSVGKECPGPARIKQMPGIVARVAATLSGKATVVPKGNQMEKTDKLTLGPTGEKELATVTKDGTISVEYALIWGGARGAQLRGGQVSQSKQLAALTAQVSALTAAVQALAAQSPEAVRAAFAEGSAQFKADLAAELAEIDVRVSLGSDEDDTKEAPSA